MNLLLCYARIFDRRFTPFYNKNKKKRKSIDETKNSFDLNRNQKTNKK